MRKIIVFCLCLCALSFLRYNCGYSEHNFLFRRIKESSSPELSLRLVETIIARQGLVAKLQAIAREAIEEPAILEPRVLARGVVLEIARELPPYSQIDIGEFLGIELNADQKNGIYEVYTLFRKTQKELTEKIRQDLLQGEKTTTLTLNPAIEEKDAGREEGAAALKPAIFIYAAGNFYPEVDKFVPDVDFSATIAQIDNLQTYELALELKGHEEDVSALAVLPDGRIVSGSVDSTIKVWDPETGRVITLRGHAVLVTALTVLPDGRIVSMDTKDTIKVWDFQTNKVITLRGFADGFGTLTLLPDGRIASGSENNTIKVWDLKTAKVITLEGHAGRVLALSVLPDGRIVSGSADKTIKVWDPETGKVITLEGHADRVLSLTVLPDGRIVSGHGDNTIKVWGIYK